MTINYYIWRKPGNHEELIAYAEENNHEVTIEYEENFKPILGGRILKRKFIPIACAGVHKVKIHEHAINESVLYLGRPDVDYEIKMFKSEHVERFEKILEERTQN